MFQVHIKFFPCVHKLQITNYKCIKPDAVIGKGWLYGYSTTLCVFLGYHSSVVEDFFLLGYDYSWVVGPFWGQCCATQSCPHFPGWPFTFPVTFEPVSLYLYFALCWFCLAFFSQLWIFDCGSMTFVWNVGSQIPSNAVSFPREWSSETLSDKGGREERKKERKEYWSRRP